ncbi:MAG: ACT domain-containing protein [Planctomycetota bacterium]|nr:ACT domain-containing protein [Planctomycetota bacterium]
MQIQTQFSIFLINKPGVLATVTQALAKARVNIQALTLMDSGEHGALRIVCDDPDATRKVLSKAHDRWTECDVLTLEMDNEPGTFARIAEKLAKKHVNISYAYCTGGAHGGKVLAVFKTPELKKAQKVLTPSKTTGKHNKRAVKQPPPGRRSR